MDLRSSVRKQKEIVSAFIGNSVRIEKGYTFHSIGLGLGIYGIKEEDLDRYRYQSKRAGRTSRRRSNL